MSQLQYLNDQCSNLISLFLAALLGPMFGLIALCFVQYDAVLTIAVLLGSAILAGAANSGFLCSHQDLAPNLAGTLLGITKSVGAVAGVINPAISSLLLHREVCVWPLV